MNNKIIAFSMLFSVLPVMVCFILFAAYWKVQRISIWRNGESKSNYLSENLGVSILWFIVFTLMVLPYIYFGYSSPL